MAYQVQRADPENTTKIVVDNETVDITSTSLSLVGRNVVDFGKHLAQNFVQVLENFADNNAPLNPMPGQLWYDNDPSVQALKLNIGTVDGDAGADWIILLMGSNVVGDEINELEGSLGSMIEGDGTYNAQAFVTHGFSHIGNTGNSLFQSLQELDTAIINIEGNANNLQGEISAAQINVDALEVSLGSFITGTGEFDDADLTVLPYIGAPMALITLKDAFININTSFTNLGTSLGIDAALEEINRIENGMGFLLANGTIDVTALNTLTNVNISADGTLLNALSDLSVAIDLATAAALDAGDLPSLTAKVNNMESEALGGMVTASGLYDNSPFSATTFLANTTSVQSALLELDASLTGVLPTGVPVAQAEVDAIETTLGLFCKADGTIQANELTAFANVPGPVASLQDALSQMDTAITNAALSGLTETQGDLRYLRADDFAQGTGPGGARYALIPLAGGQKLLIQWGQATVAGTITLATSYTNAVYSVNTTLSTTYNPKRDTWISNRTTGTFTWGAWKGGPITWLTVGVL